MTALIGVTLEHIWGFLLGCCFSLFFVIIWSVIYFMSEERREKIEKAQDEFSQGKDLYDVKVPDFLPHDGDEPNKNKRNNKH